MAKVNYVACSSCGKEYYIERMLSNALAANPRLLLKCPFCKEEFSLSQEAGGESAQSPKPSRKAGSR
jgi:hypothetical protein